MVPAATRGGSTPPAPPMTNPLEELLLRTKFVGGVSLWQPQLRMHSYGSEYSTFELISRVPHAVTGQMGSLRQLASTTEELERDPAALRAWYRATMLRFVLHEVHESVLLDGAHLFGDPHAAP